MKLLLLEATKADNNSHEARQRSSDDERENENL